MSALTVESDRERQLADKLRTLAIRDIDARGVDTAATALGIAPTGVRSLLWHGTWTLGTAFRVIDALDLDLVREWTERLDEQTSDNG